MEFEYGKQKLTSSTFWESVQVLDYMNIRKQKESTLCFIENLLFIVRYASKIKTTLCFTISECSPGHTGVGCTLRCPYPLFGQICKEVCKCSKMECNFVSGCLNGKENWLFTHERTFHPYQKVEKYGGINPPPPKCWTNYVKNVNMRDDYVDMRLFRHKYLVFFIVLHPRWKFGYC